jgi:hypothetical protein
LWLPPILAAITLLAPSSVWAGTIYYTGNPFTSVQASTGLTTSNFISGSVSFAGSLSADLVDADLSPILTSWSLSDGVNTVFDNPSFRVSTDSTGAIVAWNFTVTGTSAFGFLQIETSWILPGLSIYGTVPNADTVSLPFVTVNPIIAQNINMPGTWSANPPAAVPEPSALILLGSGLAGILLKRVQRRKPVA